MKDFENIPRKKKKFEVIFLFVINTLRATVDEHNQIKFCGWDSMFVVNGIIFVSAGQGTADRVIACQFIQAVAPDFDETWCVSSFHVDMK
jgi:hypothetical protein